MATSVYLGNAYLAGYPVSLTSIANGEVLTFDNGTWINTAAPGITTGAMLAADPVSPVDNSWWMVVSGGLASLKMRISGATVPVAQVDYD